jgi:hypothetical protein
VAPVAPTKAATVRTASSAGSAAAGQADTTGAVVPEAVKPQAPGRRPPAKKAAEARVINPGDKICSQCGEGNDPIRKFCRRCGASLIEAQIFTLPWYRRLFRRLFGGKQHQAGARPKRRRRSGSALGWLTGWVARLILLAIIVVVALSFIGPWHKHMYSKEKQWYNDALFFIHPTFTEVFAVCPPAQPGNCPAAKGGVPVTASSSAPQHGPTNLIDNAINTSWQSNGTLTGQSVTFYFAGPTDFAKIGFDNGDLDSNTSFLTEARAHVVKLVFFNQKLKTISTKTIDLKDVSTFQTYTVAPKGATGVTVEIESVYASSGAGKNVAIAQVEFYTKN